MWRFNNIPKGERQHVKQLVLNSMWDELISLSNKYNVIVDTCATCQQRSRQAANEWFTWLWTDRKSWFEGENLKESCCGETN